MAVLAQLEPKAVFHYFEEICGIPHESSDTQAISDYLVAFAKERSHIEIPFLCKCNQRLFGCICKGTESLCETGYTWKCHHQETGDERLRRCAGRDVTGTYGYGLREDRRQGD